MRAISFVRSSSSLRPLQGLFLHQGQPRNFHVAVASRAVTMTVRDALNQALDEELERDSRVFLMGEEVGQYQGAYKISKGLYQKWGGDRVVDTPITESGFAALGVGAAMSGTRPVIEFMTWNFALQAIDHIVNTAAKSRYMSGGLVECPITFRGPNGPPTAVGAQHSQCFGAWYGSIPGIKVVAPWNCDDAKGLLKAAIRDPNPVIVLESELAYNHTHALSDEAEKAGKDFLLEIGKGKVEREGNDVTLISFSRLVGECLIAADVLAKEHGISAEVINLRSLRPLDVPLLLRSVKKTGRVVVAEEGFPSYGVGAEITAVIQEGAFDYLDAPVERISSADVPMPYSKAIEELVIPQHPQIIAAALRTTQRKK